MQLRPESRPELPLAAVLVRTARAALNLTTRDVATAAGCDTDLVERIESADHDPVLDTLERLVNSVGSELRCGTADSGLSDPNPAYRRIDRGEVARLADAYGREADRRARLGTDPPGPPAGTQPDWDGRPPAPPRLFGAGLTRRDGGGWAALGLAALRARLRMSVAEFAAQVGVGNAEMLRIESGDQRPTLGQVQQLLATAGRPLRIRLEVYDGHDDGLRISALRDPETHAEWLNTRSLTPEAAEAIIRPGVRRPGTASQLGTAE